MGINKKDEPKKPEPKKEPDRRTDPKIACPVCHRDWKNCECTSGR